MLRLLPIKHNDAQIHSLLLRSAKIIIIHSNRWKQKFSDNSRWRERWTIQFTPS
jgi:hypothetical protein